MLKGIDPILRGSLLLALDRMGHGDALAIVDANYPAWKTAGDRLIQLTGIGSSATIRAVLTIFPVDQTETIDVMGPPDGQDAALRDMLGELSPEDTERVMVLDRWKFYQAAESAVTVIQTGDSRPFGNMILRKAGIN